MGSALGGYLGEVGVPVVLIGRAPHVDAIRRDGLTLHGKGGVLKPRLTAVTRTDEVAFTPDDVLFITCKSQHTRELLRSLDRAPRDTPVVCFQNGVRNEEWAASVFSRVYGGVLGFSVNSIAPGVVEHTVRNAVALGRYPEGVDSLVDEMASLLDRAGLEVQRLARVMPHKWGKLLLNLNNALYPLIDTWQQHAYADPDVRSFLAENLREGWRVLSAAGIEVDVGGSAPEAFIESVASGTFAFTEKSRSYPSTYQDVRLGRPTTEVEYFNGEIVELGKRLRIPTPFNSTLLELMRDIVGRQRPPGAYTLADLRRAVALARSRP